MGNMGMAVCSLTKFIEHLQCSRPSPLLWGLIGELRQPWCLILWSLKSVGGGREMIIYQMVIQINVKHH